MHITSTSNVPNSINSGKGPNVSVAELQRVTLNPTEMNTIGTPRPSTSSH